MGTIIETCPEFLATKDNNNRLPIHCSTCFDESVFQYSLLLADIEFHHEIGGEEGRGGLLVEVIDGFNTLQCLTDLQSSPHIYEYLRISEPPLFLKEDV
jgi:hypothetical protein